MLELERVKSRLVFVEGLAFAVNEVYILCNPLLVAAAGMGIADELDL